MTATDNNDLDNACRQVAAAAINGNWQLALAESCTGGLLAERLTAIPGASKWFSFGIVGYANTAKTGILAVPAEVLQKHGAVSEQTAAAMCIGATTLFANNKNTDGDKTATDNANNNNANGDKEVATKNNANGKTDNADDDSGNIKRITIAITGIAGPGGDDNINKPIGTICFGWQTTTNNKSHPPITETKHFPGTRQKIRTTAATHALQQAAAIISA